MGFGTRQLGHVLLKGLDVVVDILDGLRAFRIADEFADFIVFNLSVLFVKKLTLGTDTRMSVSSLYSAL